jgi:hypothetical protein
MKRRPHTPETVVIDSLAGATRAEIAVEYWGGHIGTSEQSFQVNDGPWIALPQPEGTPEPPECYMRTVGGNPAVEVPLSALREGENKVRFHAGPQVCHDFRWGFFWVYSFTIRVYFGMVEEPPTIRAEPVTEGDRVRVTIEEGQGWTAGGRHRADILGHYFGYNWSGNGRFLDWHFFLRYGELRGHVGTLSDSGDVIWDTRRVPDQPNPVAFMALVEREDGSRVVSRKVECDAARAGGHVKLYPADKVPEAFCVRMGQGKTCLFRDVELAGLVSARLLLSTWSAAHADEIGINGQMITERVGPVHDVSHDVLDVPREFLSEGTNTFYIFSRTEHHAAEINWPGPALLVEYEEGH